MSSTSPFPRPGFRKSIRVLLFLVGACNTSPLAATTGPANGIWAQPQAFGAPMQEVATDSILLESPYLFQSWLQSLGIDPRPSHEDPAVVAQLAAEHSLLVLSHDSKVNARMWLDYLAPEGMPFDTTIANAADCLDLLVESSEAPFEVQDLSDFRDDLAEDHLSQLEASSFYQQSEVPFDILDGIDFQEITSLSLERDPETGGELPALLISEILFGNSNNEQVPEPSSAILVLLATSVTLLRRRREAF